MSTHDVDFVVVGAGIGGLTAAIVAADAGLRVLVVERSERLGGVAGVSGGAVWVPLTRWSGNPDDSAAQALAYLEFVAAGHGSTAHRARFVEAGPDAVHYLADRAGVRWCPIEGHLDNYHPWAPGSVPNARFLEVEPLPGAELGEWQHRMQRTSFFPPGLTFGEMRVPAAAPAPLGTLIAQRAAEDARAGGEGLLAYLVKAAFVDRRIPVLTGTRADSLITDSFDGRAGRVVGVRLAENVEISAPSGVLLATGGYDWNPDHQPEGTPGYGSCCPPTVTGDHLVMAGEIGAEITVLPPVGMHTQLGYHLPGERYEGRPLWRWALHETGQRHTILVNAAGRRFCDESWFFHEQSRLREFDPVTRRYPNLPAYLIFDRNHRDRTAFGPYRPGRELPAEPFRRADTLPGLAEQLGIDPAGLVKSVERFNGQCTAGRDDDFGRGGKGVVRFLYPSPDGRDPVLGPVERAPFYGIELRPGGLGANQAGLRTDVDARVQHLRGRPIEGLYAAGNAAAHLDFGPSYVSGGLIARGIVGGYLAARHAARTHTGDRHA